MTAAAVTTSDGQAPIAAGVASTDLVQVIQSGGIVLASLAQIVALVPDPTAQLAAANAAIVALTQRVAALEGLPDPCVALAGAMPVATLQVGTADVAVAVPGLRSNDRISVTVLADLPAGLALGAIRPSPTTAGVLLVQTVTTLSLAGKAAVPLAVTALR